MSLSEVEIPENFLHKWQKTTDVMADIFEVPAGLIMRVRPRQIEVQALFAVSSSSATVTTVDGNLYYIGGAGQGDTVDLRSGVTLGNVFLNLNGATEMVLMASFGASPTIVGGNLQIVAGNGNVTMPDNSAQIAGTGSN